MEMVPFLTYLQDHPGRRPNSPLNVELHLRCHRPQTVRDQARASKATNSGGTFYQFDSTITDMMVTNRTYNYAGACL